MVYLKRRGPRLFGNSMLDILTGQLDQGLWLPGTAGSPGGSDEDETDEDEKDE